MDCSSVAISGPLEKLDLSAYPGVVELVLANNNITRVGAGFVDASSLVLLDLSNNAIEDVDQDAFTHVPNLQTLDLTGNANLPTLPGGVFFGLRLLGTLSMDAHLECDGPGPTCHQSHTPSGVYFETNGTVALFL